MNTLKIWFGFAVALVLIPCSSAVVQVYADAWASCPQDPSPPNLFYIHTQYYATAGFGGGDVGAEIYVEGSGTNSLSQQAASNWVGWATEPASFSNVVTVSDIDGLGSGAGGTGMGPVPPGTSYYATSLARGTGILPTPYQVEDTADDPGVCGSASSSPSPNTIYYQSLSCEVEQPYTLTGTIYFDATVPNGDSNIFFVGTDGSGNPVLYQWADSFGFSGNVADYIDAESLPSTAKPFMDVLLRFDVIVNPINPGPQSFDLCVVTKTVEDAAEVRITSELT
jgi:hypothetical protein